MPEARHIAGLAFVTALGAALVGAFAAWPAHRHLDDGLAVIKLSFDHQGARVAPCRDLTEAEIAALPAHKRKTQDCPRGRLPVSVEVLMDGAVLFAATERATGIADDGPSRFSGRAEVPAGEHVLVLRLRDRDRAAGFDHESSVTVTLEPARILVIGFDAERTAFVTR